MIKKELVDILVCPKCRKDVRLSIDKNNIICDNCKLLYKIENDIPIMLIDNAIQKDSTENL